MDWAESPGAPRGADFGCDVSAMIGGEAGCVIDSSVVHALTLWLRPQAVHRANALCAVGRALGLGAFAIVRLR